MRAKTEAGSRDVRGCGRREPHWSVMSRWIVVAVLCRRLFHVGAGGTSRGPHEAMASIILRIASGPEKVQPWDATER